MAAAAVPLLPALWVGFLADDFVGAVLLRDQGWRFPLSQLWPRGGEFLRPLSLLFFSLEGKILGLRPAALHAVHLLLYLAVVWLAARLASRLAGPAAVPWAVVLTAWYPAHAEAHLWIAGLFDLLAAALLLAGLLAALPDAAGNIRRGAVLQVFLAALLTPLAKEVGWAFPIVLVLWWGLGLLPSRPRGTALRIVAAGFAGALLTVLYRLAALGGLGGYPDTARRLTHGLMAFPRLALHAVFLPANPSYGTWSLAIDAVCASMALALTVLCIVHERRNPSGRGLIAAGLSLGAATILPALPYLHATVFWRNSRYLTLPGIGLALAAAGCLAGARGIRRALGWGLAASWLAALLLATVPWLEAARARHVVLDAIGSATRTPGAHTVWFQGPIGELHGAHLLGGHLQWAVRYRYPNRTITADSEEFQRVRAVEPKRPCKHSSSHCHLFRFEPDPPRVVAWDPVPHGSSPQPSSASPPSP